MHNMLMMLDAAPSPQVFLYMALGLGAFVAVIGLVTVSIMLIVKAIKKKKIAKQADKDEE